MKILIVEDVECLRKSLGDYFRDEGYVVEATSTGEEGLAMALAGEYAAVILDLMLPKMNGYVVLERLRAAGRTTPVILLTARGALPDLVRGLEAGADDYLVKPFEMEELLARLRALIRRSRWTRAGSPRDPEFA
jgi:DNA-binding response OmpR family regulator